MRVTRTSARATSRCACRRSLGIRPRSCGAFPRSPAYTCATIIRLERATFSRWAPSLDSLGSRRSPSKVHQGPSGEPLSPKTSTREKVTDCRRRIGQWHSAHIAHLALSHRLQHLHLGGVGRGLLARAAVASTVPGKAHSSHVVPHRRLVLGDLRRADGRDQQAHRADLRPIGMLVH